MEKGLLIVITAGVLFGYFALNMFHTASTGEEPAWNSALEDKYARYYTEDVLGDRVLNLNTLPREKAKEIWRQIPMGKELSEWLPDFDTVHTEVTNRVAEGAFRDYLLDVIETLKEKVIVGEMTIDEAKKKIEQLP